MKKGMCIGVLSVAGVLFGCQNQGGNSSTRVLPAAEIRIETSRVKDINLEGIDNLESEGLESYKSNINVFNVRIEIPKTYNNPQVKSLAEFKNAGEKEIEIVDEGDKYVAHEQIDLSQERNWVPFKFRYHLTESGGREFQNIVTLYKDLIVEGKDPVIIKNLGLQTGKKTKNYIGRLLMMSGTTLRTLGEDISLELQEFFTVNGTIETFSLEEAAQPAQQGQPGQDGGSININTGLVSGTLNINMRGGRGGKGNTAAARTDRPKKMAKDGIDAVYRYESPCYGHSQLFTRQEFKDSSPSLCYRIFWSVCAQPATNGENGTREGFKGLTGETGARGGSSGSFILISKKTVSFIRHFQILPGAGGQGGDPGAGGMGEEGGSAGKGLAADFLNAWDVEKNFYGKNAESCPASIAGNPGPMGEIGDQGPTGLAGIAEESCAPINNLLDVKCTQN